MPPPHKPADEGEVHVAFAIGAGGLLLLVAVLLGAASGINQQNPAACQIQPAATSQASTSIPANYLHLYRKTGQQYGIAWNLLAAIGKIETDHGQSNLPGVHSGENFAGAAGPMQFIAATWRSFGVDGNGDGVKNRYDPADAIPAAARYLKANGAPGNIRTAIFAYNHSTDYVNTVLAKANQYASHGAQAIAAADSPTCEQAALGPLPANSAAARVIAFARAQIGKPYVFGAEGPDSFDCSGLTMRAYQTAGITIPRKADIQYTSEPHVPRGHEQPGDLVFFTGSDGSRTRPGHVGIVIDNKRMIVAPHTGTSVQIQSYSNRKDLVGFTRPTI
jgi:cell wall-associated NlpC family hydrolase